MVKGVSRQVIVVQSPDRNLFEQAIFVLSDEAVANGVTDQQLLRQANQAIHGAARKKKGKKPYLYGPVWAAAGAGLTGLVWLISALM